MNMKYKMVFIMLLVVIFTFAVIGTHNTTVFEGLENSTENVPMCGDTSDVPACYSTVQYEDYEQFDASKQYDHMNDYILKTQVVPPVCPACPSFHGKSLEEEKKKHDEEKKKHDEEKKKHDEEKKKHDEEPLPPRGQQQQEQEQEQEQGQSQSQSTSTNVNVTVPSQGSAFPSNPNSNNVDDLKQQIRQLKQQMNQKGGQRSSEIPPCPACERCPEPAFTCEKVPNYRSTQIGSYLPIPVVNDFSTF